MTQIKKEVAMNTATKRVLELFENTGMAIDPFEKAVRLAEGTIKNLKNHKYNASAKCPPPTAHSHTAGVNCSTLQSLCIAFPSVA